MPKPPELCEVKGCDDKATTYSKHYTHRICAVHLLEELGNVPLEFEDNGEMDIPKA